MDKELSGEVVGTLRVSLVLLVSTVRQQLQEL